MEIKDRILNAMKELAGKKGFHAVTTDELAAAGGVSKRTLYRYFASKDEIIEAVLNDLITGVERRVQSIVAGDAAPTDKLRGIVGAVLEGISFIEPRNLGDLQRYYPRLWEKIERFRANRVTLFKEVYLKGCRTNHFREVNPDILLAAFLASLQTVINPQFLLSHGIPIGQAFDTLLDIFLHGIAVRSHD